MAESSALAPERGVLLATKLHMPASRHGQVLRPRLLARLDEGAARGLVLVCGPAMKACPLQGHKGRITEHRRSSDWVGRVELEPTTGGL
jgi:hypothetical protein